MLDALCPAVLVHGGAGGASRREERLAGVRSAVEAAWARLDGGGSALDSVEAGTRVLEDDPYFNAGYGSVLTTAGEVEVDAIVVEGTHMGFGAVASVHRVRNAVTLARAVMEHTPHVFLVGPGAEDLAEARGLTVPSATLVTPNALDRWRAAQPHDPGGPVGDTVGVVAVDADGRVAAATSTGGVSGKLPGRVGDSPILGAGAYADDATGAISCTGQGEHIVRVSLAFRAYLALVAGESAMEAARLAMAHLEARTPGLGGLIVATAEGGLGWAMNTAAMPVAWRTPRGAGAAFDAGDLAAAIAGGA